MAICLSNLIRHPVVQRGDPVVLSGADLLDRPIRWLHSSDIYEIAPLLRDGDMLLTTGLGLEGRGEAERRAYVRHLATRGVAGVALELCRFFTTAPMDMVEEAERLGLPMLGFRALVPFVEVTEAVNSTIVDVTVHRLRRMDEVSRGLSEVLANGGSVGELVARLAAVLDRPVSLTGPLSETTAGDQAHARRSRGEPEPEPDRAPVVLNGAVWGWLHTRHGDGERLVEQAALERAAEIVALGLLRGEREAVSHSSERRRLVAALLSGRGDREGLRARAQAAGLPLSADGYVVALARDDDPALALAALDRAARAASAPPGARSLPSPAVVTAEADGLCCTVLTTVPTGPGSPRRLAARLSAELADALPVTGAGAVGPPVRAVEDLVHSVTEARLVLRFARQVAPRTHVADAAALGAERALLRAYDVDGLARYVREQLGPLIDYDERRGTRLLDTLETLLTSAEGKAEAARRLHLRRQTLYQRLRRIGELLDADVEAPWTRAGLLLALRARHLLGDDSLTR
ncbi:PucR family transcriptional regulator [Microbispora corallina]|uniref:DNA-binding protein n=1 Tax=Microbispora corallina TaxID=83302 RepID=A0ABQ4GAP2_9ACTN|nr:PucR family transcriptional regulator [Microbispora corallina]GIH44143.1 DNA-binding protein [Microbispora corallina]